MFHNMLAMSHVVYRELTHVNRAQHISKNLAQVSDDYIFLEVLLFFAKMMMLNIVSSVL